MYVCNSSICSVAEDDRCMCTFHLVESSIVEAKSKIKELEVRTE